MSYELTMLACAAGLTILQLLVAIAGASLQVPMNELAGNREKPFELQGWAGRARRAHSNMLESLPLFAIVVLVAHAAEISNDMTVLGSQLFIYGRTAHAIVYVAGIAWLRTLAWLAATAGIVLILLQLA